MSLEWYVRRLSAMSSKELVHRTREQAKRVLSRFAMSGWDKFPKNGRVHIPGLAKALKDGMSIELENAIRKSTDLFLSGEFRCHGTRWPKRLPGGEIPLDYWRLDPITARYWPGAESFCFNIRYRHEEHLGDVKYVWDFNRLQFLQPLAASVVLWKDERSIRAINNAIESWYNANPPFQGLSWNSGIELAIRSVSLVITMALAGDQLEQSTHERVAQILRAHLFWLKRFPSLFSSANNHLVAEAMGQFVVAHALSDITNALDYAEQARIVLEREAQLQIYHDGVPAEQSPSYGAFTVEMLLVADLVGSAFKRPLASIVRERTIAYAEFIGTIGDGHGLVPNIGDDDDGRVLTLCMDHENGYPGSIARAVSGHYCVPSTIARSGDAVELRDAFFPAKQALLKPREGVVSFKEGGYTVLRRTWAGRHLHLIFDHGPLGYLSIAAHGHADANSLILSLDNIPVLVDPGTFLYHSGGSWREWFRGTGAHNTVKLNDEDQSIIAGSFNWSHKANSKLDNIVENDKQWHVAARHDGYRKRFNVDHARKISGSPKGLIIEDNLIENNLGGISRRNNIEAELVFQLAPGFSVDCVNGRLIAVNDKITVSLAFSCRGVISIYSGGEKPGEGGWVSSQFGHKEPAPRITWRGRLPNIGLRTTFDWL